MALSHDWIINSASFLWILTLFLGESQSKRTQTCKSNASLKIQFLCHAVGEGKVFLKRENWMLIVFFFLVHL